YGCLAEHVFSEKKGKQTDGMFKVTKLEEAIKEIIDFSLATGQADKCIMDTPHKVCKLICLRDCMLQTSHLILASSPQQFNKHQLIMLITGILYIEPGNNYQCNTRLNSPLC